MNKKGSAIIIVLMLVIISVAVSIFFISVSKKMIKSSNLLLDKLYAQVGVESELEIIKFYISTGERKFDFVKNVSIRNILPSRIYVDGREQIIDNNTKIRVVDTGTKFNLWMCDLNYLKSLLILKGIKRDNVEVIMESIKDWYDKDSIPNPAGAENFFYKRKNLKYVPRNSKAIQSVFELGLIKGLRNNNEAFHILKKYSVVSPDWHFNINTMDACMLSSVFGISCEISKVLVKRRKKENYLFPEDIEKYMPKNRKVFDPFIYLYFPTCVFNIDVVYKYGEAKSEKSCLIDFCGKKDVAFRVLECE